MEATMPFSHSALLKNPTKTPGSPDEREHFDPYPDKSPIIDEPPENDLPGETPSREKPANRGQAPMGH
ncbi:hypothetical protein AD943_01215 [Gluconobacter roseus]|nr:hypothetical protein AD943_01215 [Gluconobacter roseus]